MTWLGSVARPFAVTSFLSAWLTALALLSVAGCDPVPVATDASVDAGPPDSPFVRPDGSTSCETLADCEDGVPCTRDMCTTLGFCSHVIDSESCQDDLFCNGYEICDSLRGCMPGPRQTCDDGMVCTEDRCDEATRMCLRMPRDLDRDGDVDFFCEGGTDCNDRDASISGIASELCDDGVDNNCDGAIDEETCGRPPHDVCAEPLEITASGSYPISLVGARGDYGIGCVGRACTTDATCGGQTCIRSRCGGPTQDVVLSLTLETAQDVRIAAEADGFVTTLALRTDCEEIGTESECTSGFPGVIRARALPAGTYFIILTSYVGGDASVEVELSEPTLAPTNESCASPIVIPPEGGHFDGTFLDVADDHTVGCGSGGSPDLVYTFTLDAEHDVQIDVRSLTGEALSWALGTTCGSTVGQVRCAYGTPAHGTSHTLGAGTYFLVVEGSSWEEVDFALDVIIGPPTPPVRGDVCSDPIPLTPNVPFVGTLFDSEHDYDTSCGYYYRDVVHTFTLTEPSDVSIDVSAGTTYFNSSLRTSCDAGSSEIRCDQGGPMHSRVRGMMPGTYYVVVEAGRAGSYTALVTVTSPPATPILVTDNESCGGAVVLPATGGLYTGNTFELLDDYAPTYCASDGGRDATFRLDLTSRSRVIVSTAGSGFDNILYYYSGSCGGAAMDVTCNDGPGFASELSLSLLPGTYFFVVDGRTTASTGDYVFEALVRPL